MPSKHISVRQTLAWGVALLVGSQIVSVTAVSTNDTVLDTALDPQLCAAAAHSYYQPALLGPPDSSPLALGRGALRRYHWNCKLRAHEPGRAPTVDDAVDGLAADAPARWQPWTHMPQCGRTTNFCVYTQAAVPGGALGDAAFAGGGLSVLTTPEMAASLLHPHAFALQPGALALFEAVAAVAAAAPSNTTVTASPAYTVQAVAGKGRGAVAVRPVRAGEPVAVDRPVLVAHVKKTAQEADIDFAASVDDFGLAPETLDTRRRLWRAAVDQLPPATAAYLRRNLTVLPRLTRPDNEAVAHTGNTTVRAIDLPLEEKLFASNAVPVTVDGYPLMALFPKMAVFNHDCQPNLIAHFSEKTLTMALWATRDILEGEELTINYLPDLLPTEARKDLLHRRWGFACHCALCAPADPHAQLRSDQRRAAALRLMDAVPQALAAGDASGALAGASALHAVYAEEGLLRTPPPALPYASLAGFRADEPMADPFGPENFAATLGGLYAAAGDAARALPQLRAGLEEIEWRSAGWPTDAQARRIRELEMLLEGVEDQQEGGWWPWA